MSDHEREGAHAPLRGASVEVDPRRVVRLLAVAALAASVAGIAALTAAGFTKNLQLDELHQHGRPLRATVLACRSLLGGSGSNGVGYSCVGTYWLGGTATSSRCRAASAAPPARASASSWRQPTPGS